MMRGGASAVSLLVFLVFSSATVSLTCGAGLHLELTHVDAGGSYTTAERARRAVERSQRRLGCKPSAGDVHAPVKWAGLAAGEYVAEFLIGDPARRVEAIVDTGSDFIWTQCTACLPDHCFKQNVPLYNYSASHSAKPVPCTDKLCKGDVAVYGCDRQDGSCVFKVGYVSGAFAGHLGKEVFTFPSGAVELAFGCVSRNSIGEGGFDGPSGILGLGRGVLSLVSQTAAGKFSYCLTPYASGDKVSSHLFVGDSANLTGESPVLSIKFVKNPTDRPYYLYYYLPLVGITVGKTRLPIPSTLFDLRQVGPGNWSGGVLIDSGSTISLLVDGAYKALAAELTKQIGGNPVPPPSTTLAEMLDLCFARGDVDKKAPALLLHFSAGVDMPVPPANYWMPVDNSTACMAIARSNDTSSIIGNFQQQDLHVLYDLEQGQLSFQPADCSKL
ncbi:aspartic proteinase nepenthesin-1-like [Oryza brachyantha]|uniref:aspartic proteinase nepenthesin-1-like n=1 Tax=Oryza brachyantha TaxID=4533 RepID=UPI001ADB5E5F|nr:aspartic proteinase nepenthesin-1-like [Oryza brachyantha]